MAWGRLAEMKSRGPKFTVMDGRAFLARHDLLGHLKPDELDRLPDTVEIGRPAEDLSRGGDSLPPLSAGHQRIMLRGLAKRTGSASNAR